MAIKKEHLKYAANMDAALFYAGLTGENGIATQQYALNQALAQLEKGKVLEQLAEQASESGNILGAAALGSVNPNSLDAERFAGLLEAGHRNYIEGLKVPDYLAHLKSVLGYSLSTEETEEVTKALGGEEMTVGKIYAQLAKYQEEVLYEQLTAKREKRDPKPEDITKARALVKRKKIVDILRDQALKARGSALDDLVAREVLGTMLKQA